LLEDIDVAQHKNIGFKKAVIVVSKKWATFCKLAVYLLGGIFEFDETVYELGQSIEESKTSKINLGIKIPMGNLCPFYSFSTRFRQS